MKITGNKYELKDIFSKQFEFHVPFYQDPYAWTTEKAEGLFEDLYRNFKKNKEGDKDAECFLGTIVLIKKENSPEADIVDGQQRLTTLTILFAVLADCFLWDQEENFKQYIIEEKEEFENIESKPRLFLGEEDQEFFETYIQNLCLNELQLLDPEELEDDAQRYIQENCELFEHKIRECFGNKKDEIYAFAKFLVNSCSLLVVSADATDDAKSAFMVRTVMDYTEMDLPDRIYSLFLI